MAHEETSLNGSSTENEFAQRSDSDDETTPTSVRQSQVAALLERRTNGNTGPGNDERQFEGFTAAAGDVASVLLSPSLKDNPSLASLANTGKSSGSDSTTFTTYGLQRALNATVPLPSDIKNKQQIKDKNYRSYVSDRHDVLSKELDESSDLFDSISEARDLNTDLAKADTLNRMYFEANIRRLKAQRAHRTYVSAVDELQYGTKMSREEAQKWYERKLLEEQQRKDGDELIGI